MKRLSLPALEVRQGRHTLYCFAVDGKLLSQFAAVCRLKRGDEGIILGYQRPELLKHVAQIRSYLETAGALLPNALVVAFDRPLAFTPSGPAAGFSWAPQFPPSPHPAEIFAPPSPPAANSAPLASPRVAPERKISHLTWRVVDSRPPPSPAPRGPGDDEPRPVRLRPHRRPPADRGDHDRGPLPETHPPPAP